MEVVIEDDAVDVGQATSEKKQVGFDMPGEFQCGSLIRREKDTVACLLQE
jgi:hypothetical protein